MAALRQRIARPGTRSSGAPDRLAGNTLALVVPGHALPGQAHDASQIAYSQAYLARFETELKAADSATLIGEMKKACPAAGLGIALDMGAKVNQGEMKG